MVTHGFCFTLCVFPFIGQIFGLKSNQKNNSVMWLKKFNHQRAHREN